MKHRHEFLQLVGFETIARSGMGTAKVKRALILSLATSILFLLTGALTAGAQITVNNSGYAFGDQIVGSSTASFTFTVTNQGSSSVSYTVTHPADFQIDWSSGTHCYATGHSLAPHNQTGDSCTITAYFQPTGTSSYSENITFGYTGGPLLLTLTGTGIASDTTVYYVSPQGNDAWTGQLYQPNETATDGPFASLHGARTAISGHAAGKKVEFESGTYYVGIGASTLYTATVGGNTSSTPIPTVCSASGATLPVCPEVFTAGDSGNTTDGVVTYEAAPGAQAVLSGGIRLPASAWHLYANGVYYADLNTTNLGGASPVDFSTLYVDTGNGTTGVAGATRRFRPRAAATGNGDDPKITASGWLRVMEPVSYDNTVTQGQGNCGSGIDNAYCAAVNVCGAANVATRTYLPGSTTHKTYYCDDRFAYYHEGTIDLSSSWTNFAADSTGKTSTGGQSMELSIDEQFDMSKMRLKSVSTTWTDEKGNIVPVAILNGPLLLTGYGAQYRSGDKYIVDAVQPSGFGQLQAGEWFVDETGSPWRLYYHPLGGETITSSATNAWVIVPQAAQLIVSSNTSSGQGSDHLGASFITFQGLTFSYDNWTVPPTGYQGSQMEPRLTGAISFINPEYVTFSKVTVAHTGDYGIEFLNDNTVTGGSTISTSTSYDCAALAARHYSECNSVADSLMYDLGGGAVRVGSFPSTSESDSNEIMATSVTDTLIQGYGRIVAGADGITVAPSHDDKFSNNEITDGYKNGVAICLPQGSQTACRLFDAGGNPVADANGAYNDKVEFNLIHNIGQGTLSDLAGVYFAAIESDSTFGVGSNGSLPDGDEVDHNRIYDITQPVEDDGSTGYVYDSGGNLTTETVTNPIGYGGNGVYTDQQSQSVEADKNLIYRVTDAALMTTFGPSDGNWLNSPLDFENNITAYFGTAAVDVSQQEPGNVPAEWTSKQWPERVIFKKNFVYFDDGYLNPSTSRYASVQGGGAWSCSEDSSLPCSSTGNQAASSSFDFDENGYCDTSGSSRNAGNLNGSSAFYVDSPVYTGSGSTYTGPTTLTGVTYGYWKGTATGHYAEDANSQLMSATASVFVNPACGTDNYALGTDGLSVAGNTGFQQFLSDGTIGRTDISLTAPSNIAPGWPLYFPGGSTSQLPTNGTYPTGYCSWF